MPDFTMIMGFKVVLKTKVPSTRLNNSAKPFGLQKKFFSLSEASFTKKPGDKNLFTTILYITMRIEAQIKCVI